MGNYRPFLQGPLPVANYTRIIIPGRFWTRPPSTKSTRMASSATPLHDSLIELAIPDAHAHAIKWYLKKNGVGCYWNNHFLGALCYADDIALLAPSAALRLMLDTYSSFVSSCSLLFNVSSLRPNLFVSHTLVLHSKFNLIYYYCSPAASFSSMAWSLI